MQPHPQGHQSAICMMEREGEKISKEVKTEKSNEYVEVVAVALAVSHPTYYKHSHSHKQRRRSLTSQNVVPPHSQNIVLRRLSSCTAERRRSNRTSRSLPFAISPFVASSSLCFALLRTLERNRLSIVCLCVLRKRFNQSRVVSSLVCQQQCVFRFWSPEPRFPLHSSSDLCFVPFSS